YMLVPPWRHSRPEHQQDIYELVWIVGWGWTFAGLVLGALVAPSLVQFARLSQAPYQDGLVIGAAVIIGFLVQLLGWCLFALCAWGLRSWPAPLKNHAVFVSIVPLLLSPAVLSYGLPRYVTWVGEGQRSVTVAFVGALLFELCAILLIKGIVTGALLRWFIGWLRGEDAKPKGA